MCFAVLALFLQPNEQDHQAAMILENFFFRKIYSGSFNAHHCYPSNLNFFCVTFRVFNL